MNKTIEQTKIGQIEVSFKPLAHDFWKYAMYFTFQNTVFTVKLQELSDYKKDLHKCIDMYIKAEKEKDEKTQVEAQKAIFLKEYNTLNIDNLKALKKLALQYMFDAEEDSTQYFYTAMYQATDRLILQKQN